MAIVFNFGPLIPYVELNSNFFPSKRVKLPACFYQNVNDNISFQYGLIGHKKVKRTELI